ncbi:MAG: hypothetical protein J6X02_01375, partial [Bacilli bacterium]|nr:hypothetical protein [Bacilli bacterium]
GYEYDDLYQIGLYALYKTLKTYDSESSLFYTYLGKSLENSIINIIKENDCDKRSLLSKALSYDEEIPNTNLTYLEVFPDLSIKPFDKVIIYQRTYIDIKNSLSFDLACLFELLNEGFNCNEIIQLLSISIKEYDKMVKNIKKQIHYNC